MYFDPGIKRRREDLFDREGELLRLNEAVRRGERIVLVTGLRRIGKSSIVSVFLAEWGGRGIMLDLKGLYFEYGSVPKRLFVAELLRAMGEEPRNADLLEVLRILDSGGERAVLALDEAQYLRFSGGFRFDGVLAWAYDNLDNLTIVLTGSEIGMLEDFLRFEDPAAPLYGRTPYELSVGPFDRAMALRFLKEGFAQEGMEVPEGELEEVVDALGGIPGWLTIYGHMRARRGLDHRSAIASVYEEGSRVVMGELERAIQPARRRYLAILRAISLGLGSWSKIKAYAVALTGPITDARFTGLLRRLEKLGFVAKQDDQYVIPDPVIRKAVEILDRA